MNAWVVARRYGSLSPGAASQAATTTTTKAETIPAHQPVRADHDRPRGRSPARGERQDQNPQLVVADPSRANDQHRQAQTPGHHRAPARRRTSGRAGINDQKLAQPQNRWRCARKSSSRQGVDGRQRHGPGRILNPFLPPPRRRSHPRRLWPEEPGRSAQPGWSRPDRTASGRGSRSAVRVRYPVVAWDRLDARRLPPTPRGGGRDQPGGGCTYPQRAATLRA